MENKVLSFADEILSLDNSSERGLSRFQVRGYLTKNYGADRETADAVIDVLDGEGYFDGF